MHVQDTETHLVLRSRTALPYANSSSCHSRWTAAVWPWACWLQPQLSAQPHERQGQCQKVALPPLPWMHAQQRGQPSSHEQKIVTVAQEATVPVPWSRLSIHRIRQSHSSNRYPRSILPGIAPPAQTAAAGAPARRATHAGPRPRRIAACVYRLQVRLWQLLQAIRVMSSSGGCCCAFTPNVDAFCGAPRKSPDDYSLLLSVIGTLGFSTFRGESH